MYCKKRLTLWKGHLLLFLIDGKKMKNTKKEAICYINQLFFFYISRIHPLYSYSYTQFCVRSRSVLGNTLTTPSLTYRNSSAADAINVNRLILMHRYEAHY